MVPLGFFRRMYRVLLPSSTKYVGLLCPYPILVDVIGSFKFGMCCCRYAPSLASSRSCRAVCFAEDMFNQFDAVLFLSLMYLL